MGSFTLLQNLQSLKSNGHYITTVYLDLSTPQKLRNAETVINNMHRAKKEKSFFKNMTEVQLQSVEKDIAGIIKYINNQFSMKQRSLMIVSSSEAYVWQVIPLGMEVENMLVIQDRAYLRPLLQAASQMRNYGIILVDQGKAKIVERRFGHTEELWATVNILPDSRNDAGYQGTEEKKNQRKAEESVTRHYKMITAKINELHQKNRFNWIVVGGVKEAVAEFRKYIQNEMNDLVFSEFHIDPNESLDKIVEKVKNEEEKHRLAFETALLEKLNDEFHQSHKAVLGIKHTEEALTSGQVDTLVMRDDFHKKGWFCTWCGYITADDESACPNCRHEMTRTVDITDELAHSALDTGAKVEYLAASMGEYDPVAAILRYPK